MLMVAAIIVEGCMQARECKCHSANQDRAFKSQRIGREQR